MAKLSDDGRKIIFAINFGEEIEDGEQPTIVQMRGGIFEKISIGQKEFVHGVLLTVERWSSVDSREINLRTLMGATDLCSSRTDRIDLRLSGLVTASVSKAGMAISVPVDDFSKRAIKALHANNSLETSLLSEKDKDMFMVEWRKKCALLQRSEACIQ